MNDIFKNIIAQKNLLLELSKHKSHYKTAILKKAQPQLILAICESIYNILEGKVPLNLIQKQELKKYKAILRKLVQKNKIKYKKHLLTISFKSCWSAILRGCESIALMMTGAALSRVRDVPALRFFIFDSLSICSK